MRNLVLAAAIAAFPAVGSAYDGHPQCIQKQLQLYQLLTIMDDHSRDVSKTRNDLPKGPKHDEMQAIKDEMTAAIEATKAAVRRHARYCASIAP